MCVNRTGGRTEILSSSPGRGNPGYRGEGRRGPEVSYPERGS